MRDGWIKNGDGTWNFYINNQLVTGWLETNNKWFYMNGEGVMQTGWVQINTVWYYFHKDDDNKTDAEQGEMVTGWFNSSGNWYFLNDISAPSLNITKGKMVTGWLQYKGKWYFLNDNVKVPTVSGLGIMIYNCTTNIDGTNYTFNPDGSMQDDKIVTLEQLKQLNWIHAEDVIDDLNSCLKKFDITTPERIRHFMSQCAHESGKGYYMVEEASGNDYNGRSDLGNTQAGDGPRFKGGGYIQITGRANYQALANYLNDQNVMQGCKYVAEHYPWTSAGYWWHSNNMNTLCDVGANVVAITKRVNGGTNGLTERQRYYNICCNIF